jgi:hypothetical protein
MNPESVDWKLTAATIHVNLDHDPHLADSSLARAGGPDATLACAECGRRAVDAYNHCFAPYVRKARQAGAVAINNAKRTTRNV